MFKKIRSGPKKRQESVIGKGDARQVFLKGWAGTLDPLRAHRPFCAGRARRQDSVIGLLRRPELERGGRQTQRQRAGSRSRAPKRHSGMEGPRNNKPRLTKGFGHEGSKVSLPKRAMQQGKAPESLPELVSGSGTECERCDKHVELLVRGAHIKNELPKDTVIGRRDVQQRGGRGTAPVLASEISRRAANMAIGQLRFGKAAYRVTPPARA